MENQSHNERPMIQNNFYGNIGQQINHVDKIEAHFDKDMGITLPLRFRKIGAIGKWCFILDLSQVMPGYMSMDRKSA